MFHLKVQTPTYPVEAPELEAQLLQVMAALIRIEAKVDQVLAAEEGTPRVVFTIGPIREQE